MQVLLIFSSLPNIFCKSFNTYIYCLGTYFLVSNIGHVVTSFCFHFYSSSFFHFFIPFIPSSITFFYIILSIIHYLLLLIHYILFIFIVLSLFFFILLSSPVGRGSRIHRLHLCRGVRLPQRQSRIRH